MRIKEFCRSALVDEVDPRENVLVVVLREKGVNLLGESSFFMTPRVKRGKRASRKQMSTF